MNLSRLSLSVALGLACVVSTASGCVADGTIPEDTVAEPAENIDTVTEALDPATGLAAMYTASLIAKNFGDAYASFTGGGASLDQISAMFGVIDAKLNLILASQNQLQYNANQQTAAFCFSDARHYVDDLKFYANTNQLQTDWVKQSLITDYNRLAGCIHAMADDQYYLGLNSQYPDKMRIEYFFPIFMSVATSLMAIRTFHPAGKYTDPATIQLMAETVPRIGVYFWRTLRWSCYMSTTQWPECYKSCSGSFGFLCNNYCSYVSNYNCEDGGVWQSPGFRSYASGPYIDYGTGVAADTATWQHTYTVSREAGGMALASQAAAFWKSQKYPPLGSPAFKP